MAKTTRQYFKNHISLRDLLRIDTVIIVSVFLFFTALIFWRTHEVMLEAHHKEIALLLDQEEKLLANRFLSYQMTLDTIQSIINKNIKDGKKVDEVELESVMISMISGQSYVFNVYYALEPKYARKLSGHESYVYVVHKDIRLLGTEKFSQKKNIIQERFFEGDYFQNPKEVWYHAAKKDDSLQITPPYFDSTYMKVTMFSLVVPLKDAQGKFAGAVGLDVPLSVLLTENFRRTAGQNYRLFITIEDGRPLESLLQESYRFPEGPKNSEFELDAKNIVFNLDEKFTIEGDSGKTFDGQSRPVRGGLLHLITMRDRSRIAEPLWLLYKGVLSSMVVILLLQIYLSRWISLRIFKNVSKLFENFRVNTALLRLTKDNFDPEYLSPLEIKDLDEIRILWQHFLDEFHLSMIEVKKEKDKSDKAAAFQSSFLANMSHEIRTPMNAILGMTDILAETPLDSEQQRYLRVFKRASESLLSLLDDILDVAKIEAGSMVIEHVNMDLNKIKEDTVMVFFHKADAKSIRFDFQIFPDVDVYVKTDPVRLRQIIYNLVGNAIKFTDSGGVEVSISTGIEPDEITIKISDTGVGIPENKLSNIFEKFTQADASTTRKFGGTGLGLSIVRSLVQMMGGVITVESREGVGSTFSVRLPVQHYVPTVAAPIAVLPSIPVKKDLPRNQKMRVLLADDVRENRMVAELYLRSMGLDCDIATNGQEVVDKYRLGQYDLVLMDIQMPIKDGVEAMKEIREFQKNRSLIVPIIALTAFASKADNDRFMKEGFDSYLTKPLLKKTFEEALRPYMQENAQAA